MWFLREGLIGSLCSRMNLDLEEMPRRTTHSFLWHASSTEFCLLVSSRATGHKGALFLLLFFPFPLILFCGTDTRQPQI